MLNNNYLIKESCICILLFFISIIGIAQNSDEKAIAIEASYTSDIVTNLTGGIKTGITYVGLVDFAVGFNTEALKAWKGGEFVVGINNTHGGLPTENLIGDIQFVDNLESGNHLYLYQLWYGQKIGNLSFTIGKQDVNYDFFTSDMGGEYINSAFGIMSLATINVPVSIYPKTTIGSMVRYDISDAFAIQAAIYDGDPLDFDSDPHSLDFKISKDEGFMSFAEIHYMPAIKLPGTYKIGYFGHSTEYDDLTDSTKSYNSNFGLYAIAEQMIFNENESEGQGLGIFFQSGFTPKNRNFNDLYLAFGLNYYGLFPGREDDVIGLAIARASISNQLIEYKPVNYKKHETAIELVYGAYIANHITIKPNLQYIINPGANASLKNAFAGILRFELTL